MPPAEPQSRTVADRAARTPSSTRTVMTGLEAVRAAERALCGAGAVDDPSVAEGLAAGGAPAAALPPAEGPDAAGARPTVEAAWVRHRLEGGEIAEGFAFEFMAADAQEAVDHAVAAHLLAARLARPGVCVLAEDAARRASAVDLPGSALRDRVAHAAADPSADRSYHGVLRAAEEVLEELSALTGRSRACVTTGSLDDADVAIVSEATRLAEAQGAVEALRAAGIRAGFLVTHLVRPFPNATVARVLDKVATAVVVHAERDRSFLQEVREALARREALRVAHPAAPGAAALAAAVAEAIGKAWTVPHAPLAPGAPVPALALAPRGPWADALMLDVAAALEGGAFDARACGRTAALARFPGRSDGEPGAALIVVGAVAVLADPEVLAEVGPKSKIVVLAESAAARAALAELPAEARDALAERGATLAAFDLAAVEGPADDAFLDKIAREAVLAAARSVRAGHDLPAPLVAVDLPARMAGDGPSPVVPSAPESVSESWKIAARRFHLAGAGARSADDPWPAGPLVPLATVPAAVGGEGGAELAAYAAAIATADGSARARFAAEVRDTISRLDGLLGRSGKEGRSPSALGASLGVGGAALLDLERLADSLPAERGPRVLAEVRRERLAAARAALSAYLERDAATPAVHFVHALGDAVPELPGTIRHAHPRPIEAAIGLVTAFATRRAAAERAMRLAQLELDGRYDPDRHDSAIARLDVERLGDEALLSLPRVAAVGDSARLLRAGLSGLARALRSALPVHIVALDGGRGDALDLAFLALAARRAWVLASTPAAPEHLADGFRALARTPRPAIAIVARATGRSAGLRLAGALAARATPCLRFDPDRGTTLAERFSLAGNPQPEEPWPVVDARVASLEGADRTVAESWTPAHSAALDPELRAGLRVIPTDGWNDEQIALAEWLTLDAERASHSVPFIHVVRPEGVVARALVDRALATGALERSRAWRTLQELGGIHDDYARRAAESALETARGEAAVERERLEVEHRDQLVRAKATSAEEIVGKLVSGLLGLEGPVSVAAPADLAGTPAPTAAPAAPEAAPTPAGPIETPYIDTVLCTSCQDCININGRMFKYDGNKQAYVADRKAGTFEQLVKAAEKCPARCIHPGQPLPGDKSATPALLERAKKFN